MIDIKQIDELLTHCTSIDPTIDPQGAILWQLREAVETVAGYTSQLNINRAMNATLRNEIKNLKIEARNRRFIDQFDKLDVNRTVSMNEQLDYKRRKEQRFDYGCGVSARKGTNLERL